jgi:hypothetical protein
MGKKITDQTKKTITAIGGREEKQPTQKYRKEQKLRVNTSNGLSHLPSRETCMVVTNYYNHPSKFVSSQQKV